ncbi:hypothetical protein [Ulvibacterium marinum]|uniref:hypothetical protein n=1 Tax=Ulvibacterium marinum TaxID=2419782 RepID=UPI00249425AF|nr:hypothetical protein [Ulvibacterium marinum]
MDLQNPAKKPRESEKLKTEHDFYRHLVDYLSPIDAITKDSRKNLKAASYAYFRGLLVLDGVIDRSISPLSFIDGLNSVEVSIKILSKLFPIGHPFWIDFEKCKATYFKTLQVERKNSKDKYSLSETEFDEVAKGKSSVCYAIVHALSYLALNKDEELNKDLIECLEQIHIAFQCKDDIDDFFDDLENGQHTYAHVLVFKSLEKEAKVVTNPKNDFLLRYFYVSGKAQFLISKAISHLEQAGAIAEKYRLSKLNAFIKQEIVTSNAQIHEIQLLIDKTKSKLNQKEKIIPRSDNMEESILDDAVQRGVNFLLQSFEEGHILSDFMTSAGVGKNWISNYAAFLLAGYSQTEKIIKRLKKSDAVMDKTKTQASYNTSIVQDSDSLAFHLAAHKLMFNHTNVNELEELKKFQGKDCGWRTYINENKLRKQINLDKAISLEGWISSHNCVSASICYILSSVSKDLYLRTAEFLSKRIHENGSLDSYWWSSPVYATSWYIMALSQDDLLKNECQQSVHWLVKGQKANGSWVDRFSRKESFFYTSLATKALLTFNEEKYQKEIRKGLSFLLNNQIVDGSWKSDRILAIPQTDVMNQADVKRWRRSSFGVNVLVDDHKRIFTTVTVLNTLLNKLSTK